MISRPEMVELNLLHSEEEGQQSSCAVHLLRADAKSPCASAGAPITSEMSELKHSSRLSAECIFVSERTKMYLPESWTETILIFMDLLSAVQVARNGVEARRIYVPRSFQSLAIYWH